MEDQHSFVEYGKGTTESSIWRFFLTEKNGQYAKCIKCKKVLKTKGGCTNALHTHAHSIHGINTLKRHAPAVELNSIGVFAWTW